MKEYFKSGAYSTPKEKEEARYLNEYANLYAQYVDDDEDHVYQHIEDNLLDVAPVNELKKRIHITKENIKAMLKRERIRSTYKTTDIEYEEIATKFGKELAASCKKANISGKSLRELTDNIEALINDIIENYPEIDDTFVNLSENDDRCRIDIIFTDGIEITVSLRIETHYTITNDISVY